MHGSSPRRLDADDFHLRAVSSQPGRHSRHETSAPDRNEDGARVGGHLRLQLDANRSLSGDREGIIVGMNIGASRCPRGLLCEGVGAIERSVHDDLLDPLPADRRDPAALLAWRVGRKVDRAAHPQVGAGVGQSLRVIAGRGTHDAALTLGRGEQRHASIGATNLEGTALLLVLTFEQNVHARLAREALGALQVRAHGNPLQGRGGLTNIRGRGHVRTSGHGCSFQYPSSVVVATPRGAPPDRMARRALPWRT